MPRHSFGVARGAVGSGSWQLSSFPGGTGFCGGNTLIAAGGASFGKGQRRSEGDLGLWPLNVQDLSPAFSRQRSRTVS